MKRIIIILIPFFSLSVMAQQVMTLENCYALATENYPLAQQTQLLQTQTQLDKEVINNINLPQLSLDVQATYQSDVIEIPLPNVGIEPLNNDQYRATLSINQLIYNGGATEAALNVKSAQVKTKQKQVEVQLYQLKQRVNQYYFSILLAQETNALLKARQAQLQAKISELKTGIQYGVVLPSSDKVLEAELLKITQQLMAIETNRVVLITSLASIIGQPLDDSINLQKPLVETQINTILNRPELELFQLKKEEVESNEAFIGKQDAPKLLGFATGGYGNPGLNMLDNSFQTFYIVGVKLNWNVFDWNSNKKQRQSLSINKDLIDTEAETFTLNTINQLHQQQKEIEKLESFITSDMEIINLRKDVLQTADSQLKNGVITSSAFLTELTKLYEDESTLVQHRIQLQLTKANYNVIKGL